jgi:hypothetical protein
LRSTVSDITLSTQILMMRKPQRLFESLREYPRYVLLPHRLIPYPDLVRTDGLPSPQLISSLPLSFSFSQIQERWVRRPAVFLKDSSHGWSHLSCCLPAGQRCESRDSWVKIQATEGKANTTSASYPVSILPIYDLKIALGNANFLEESYRGCKLFDHQVERCDAGAMGGRRRR